MKEQPGDNRLAVLVIAALSSFLTPFMGSATTVALPAIGEEFAMSAVALSWVATAYIAASATFLLPLGRLADIHGRKRLFLIGILTDAVSSFCLAVAPSAEQLLAFRAVQGLGGAMIFCTSMAILLSVIPAAERGRALGINVAAVYAGLSMGPVLGGLLTHYCGWRSIFVFTCACGLVTFALAAWKLEGEGAKAQQAGAERFDVPGAAFYCLSLLALAGAFSWLPQLGGLVLLLCGLAGFVAFVVWETKAAQPLLDIALFRRNTVFAFSNLAALINYAATFAVGFLLSLYLQHIKNLGPREAGLVLLCQPLLMALFSPLAGRLSDRIEPRVVASAGMGMTACGLLLLAFLDDHTTLGYVIACQVLLGLGLAFFSSPNTNAVMSSVGKPVYGVASAILSTMRQVGFVLSMGLVTLILALHLGRAHVEPAVYPQFLASLKTAFPVLAGLCFLGIPASLARGNVRKK